MLSKILYASLGAEIVRNGRTTTESSKLKSPYETLISRMINQGTQLKSSGQCLCKKDNRNLDVLVKLGSICEKILNFLFH